MKTIKLTLLFALFTLLSSVASAQNTSFGIYEVYQLKEIPANILNNLKKLDMKIESNQESFVVGYIAKNDASQLNNIKTGNELRLIKSVFSVGKEKNYFEIIAVNPTPAIDISDLGKTKVKDGDVVLYFNFAGANKWADFTKKNSGKQAAFVINGELYSLTFINNEIRNGLAMINCMKNTELATKISEALNSAINKK